MHPLSCANTHHDVKTWNMSKMEHESSTEHKKSSIILQGLYFWKLQFFSESNLYFISVQLQCMEYLFRAYLLVL